MNLQDLTFEDRETRVAIDKISEVWQDWMTEESYEMFRNKSFYDMNASAHPLADKEFGSKLDNVRVLALNLQSCYHFNFFLFSEMGGELGELEWLEDTLREMEKNGEKAIVIGHIPPGSADCVEPFSRRYAALMDRFQNVVRTSVWGHDHVEYYDTVRAIESKKAINQNIISGSATTHVGQNPSFRRVILDKEHLVPVEIETYFVNVTYYNEHEDEIAEFEKLYEFGEAYGLDDLRPSNLLKLAEGFEENEESAKIMKDYYTSKATVGEPCDFECRQKFSCQSQYNVHQDVMDCKEKLEVYDYFHILFSVFTDPWIEPVNPK